MYTPLTAEQQQMDALLQQHPELKNDTAARMFFVWLLAGNHRIDETTGKIILPYQLVAFIQGKPAGHAQTGEFLQEFQENYLSTLKISEYWHQGHKCRAVDDLGMSEAEIMEWLKEPVREPVLAKTLKRWTVRQQEEAIRAMRNDYAKTTYTTPEQQFVMTYLNSLPISLFRMTEENRRHAFELANGRDDQGHSLRILHNLIAFPMEFYRTSTYGRSMRAFGFGPQYLPKEVRQQAFPDWTDLDIVNAQTAILAGLCKLPLLSQLFKEKGSIWPELLSHLGLSEQKAKAKPHLKIANYSVFFGKQSGQAERAMVKALAGEELEPERKLFDHPYMQEIAEGLDRLRTQAIQEGGMMTPYGWMYYYPGSDIDTFIACIIQAYEFWLLVPAYQIAEKNKDSFGGKYQVTLHQHDGFSILVAATANEKKIREQIAREIWARGLEMGMFVTVE